jgi:hypothetical protein
MLKRSLLIGGMAISMTLFMSGCMKEKKIPADKLITIYDSNLQETKKITPLDTLYAKIVGLAPNTPHIITITDPNGLEVTKVEMTSDENGVINPTPIWYDVGLKREKDGNYTIAGADGLALKSFWLNVTSLDGSTNFRQDFFILLKEPNANEMRKPIVYSISVKDGNASNESADNIKMENTFLETGTKTADGKDDPLTKVYVKGDQIPLRTWKNGEKVDVDKVDIYVVPFSNIFLKEGTELKDMAISVRKNILTKQPKGKNYKILPPTLVWDLDRDPTLVNPGDSNNAYRIIVDVNQNGRFDIGKDIDNNGKVDEYVDGIDGQGSAGFIVMNTEANEKHFKITDKNGDALSAIPENQSSTKTDLYFSMKNIPTTARSAKLFVIDKDAVDLDNGEDLNSSEVRTNESSGSDITIHDKNESVDIYMPYIDKAKFINNKNGDDMDYNKSVDVNKPLDIVLDMNENGKFDKGTDYYFPNSVTILPVDDNVTTMVDSDGNKKESSIFNETNSDANTTVYLKFSNGNDNGSTANAYLYKAGTAPKVGDKIYGALFEKDDIDNSNGAVSEFIDFNKDYTIKNPTEKNNKYTILVDMNHDGDVDDNDVKVEITVNDTDANSLPDVSYINIASGGLMGHTYQHWTTSPYTSAYDYRDIFTVDSENTIPTEWWWASWYTERGIKAVWNPYMRTAGWWLRKVPYYINEKGEKKRSPLNRGQVVDLYIVDASKYKLKNSGTITDADDVRGRRSRLPVQFSCRNGLNLQTIWKAPLKVGKYYVIIDVNKDGKITDGIDLIDAVTKNGRTIKDDPNIVGFKVVE